MMGSGASASAAPAAVVSCPAVSSSSAAPLSLKQCSCCACVYTTSEFFALPSFREWRIGGDWLGIAECTGCFSTISVRLGDDLESAS